MIKTITSIALSAVLFAMGGSVVKAQLPANTEPYPLNFDKNTNKNRAPGQERYINLIQYSPEYRSTTLRFKSNFENQRIVYINTYKTVSDYIRIIPGTKISFDVSWYGRSMDGYWYLDKNQNGKFDVTDENSEELVMFSCIEKDGRNIGKKAGVGIVPFEGDPNDRRPRFPKPEDNSFIAPSKPGEYRLRYKIDWNSIDPGGRGPSGGNYIANNGGNVVDFVLKVLKPTDSDIQYFSYKLNIPACNNGNYATMVLPFAVKLPNDIRAYKLKPTATSKAICFERIQSSLIPANTPVFLASDQPKVNVKLEGVPSSETALETNLHGSIQPLTKAQRQEDQFDYFILIKNEEGNAEFRIVKDHTFPANRCHIRLPKQQAGAMSRSIEFVDEVKNPTSVVKVATETSTDKAIYNLAGQRIENTAAKGVVIVNGKKVVLP